MPAATINAIQAGDLHLWLVDLLASDDDIEQGAKVLAPDETARAERFHFARDARRYVVAHAALRRILAGYLAASPAALRFATNRYGKPALVLDALPDRPALTFNLSHSGDLALIGVAVTCRLGVDIEQIRPEFASGTIAQQFFSPAEIAALDALPVQARISAFFRCWTRKEAFIKARGEGLSLPLNSFDVTLRADEPPGLLRIEDEPESIRRWRVYDVPIDETAAYQAAAITEGTPTRIATYRHLLKS